MRTPEVAYSRTRCSETSSPPFSSSPRRVPRPRNRRTPPLSTCQSIVAPPQVQRPNIKLLQASAPLAAAAQESDVVSDLLGSLQDRHRDEHQAQRQQGDEERDHHHEVRQRVRGRGPRTHEDGLGREEE
eukprot:CAMPEP_0177554036 /NCGR_PEP_ID=MMETSP0369-20130122/67752_1 /TAXON_ID=447022 ORGANISM="Scrippsiella hangoei-like, Strain SHHI-4" /NCGR_SAMPLE_ID=MMETSP0369 /ASSEMBLY_ACC=CAM_ASM_000364 /LENGTH=128 /DNA_ID=CAMNT_0019039999 /DNA_START=38 /DNA_END=422 /DNA_ORIENTATION=+